MKLNEVLETIVDIARHAVDAQSWFYGPPSVVPSGWPCVYVEYLQSTPNAHGQSTRGADGRMKRNSRNRIHRGMLYVLVGETLQPGINLSVANIAELLMDAFDGDESLRGSGSRDRVQVFTLTAPTKIDRPLSVDGPLVTGITSAFEFVIAYQGTVN